MRIDQVILREISIPLKFQFSQANNSTSKSDSAIIELITEDGVSGFGEACPRLYVTGESMTDVQKDLQQLVPDLKIRPVESLEDLKNRVKKWEATGIGPSTRCGLELALLDAWSRTEKTPILELLNHQKNPANIVYSLVLPLIKPKYFRLLLEKIQGFKPANIKLKVDQGMEDNLERISLIRECFGADISIRVDANAGWTLEEATQHIPAFLKAGILSFEQPLAAGQLEGMAALTTTFGQEAQIMADESLTSFALAEKLLEEKCCNHFNLKISKLGGILRTLDIYQLADAHNIPCQLGAHFGETSLLSAAAVILTSLAGPMSANEGALGNFLLEKDIFHPPVQHQLDGSLSTHQVIKANGLAGKLDLALLEHYTYESTAY